MHKYVQLMLNADIYTDPRRLSEAIAELRQVGAFSTLDDTYAASVGLIRGEVPEERIHHLKALLSVNSIDPGGEMTIR